MGLQEVSRGSDLLNQPRACCRGHGAGEQGVGGFKEKGTSESGSEVCVNLSQVRKARQEPWHPTAHTINVSSSTDLFSSNEKFTSQREERREERPPDWETMSGIL